MWLVEKRYSKETCYRDTSKSRFKDIIQYEYSREKTDSEIIQGITESWVNKKDYYDYDTKTCDHPDGCHPYTRMVWAEWTKMGCYAKQCVPIRTTGRFSLLPAFMVP